MATLAQAWQRVTRNDQLLLFFLAVLVGTAAGYGALLFRPLTSAVQMRLFGHGGQHVASAGDRRGALSGPGARLQSALLAARAAERGES